MKPENLKRYLFAIEKANEILKEEKNMTAEFVIIDEGSIHDGWYVVVTCENGYKYKINVSGDSVLTMLDEVFHFISFK